jgi:hypothetical protein
MSRGSITLDVSNATKETPANSELLDIGGYKWWVSENKTHKSVKKKQLSYI